LEESVEFTLRSSYNDVLEEAYEHHISGTIDGVSPWNHPSQTGLGGHLQSVHPSVTIPRVHDLDLRARCAHK